MEGGGDGDGDRGEEEGEEEECVVRDVKVRLGLGDESCDALPVVWSGLVCAASKNTDQHPANTEQGFNKPVYFRRCLDSFQGQKVTTWL